MKTCTKATKHSHGSRNRTEIAPRAVTDRNLAVADNVKTALLSCVVVFIILFTR
jgi:hypothetical protein